MRREARPGAGAELSVLVWDAESGAQPPVVLLHGTGLTAEDWSEVAADLSRDRTVHAVDLRGHGGSAWPGTYSVELMTADVLALLGSAGEEVDLVGHSLGGLVACRVAARSPHVRRLVLEDVGLLRPRMPAAPVRPEGHLAFDWAVVEQVRPEVDTPAADWPEVLAGIAVPVLAVSGGPSSFVPQEWVDDLVGVVPRATSVTIDAGHEVHAARPREFLAAVRGFLAADGVDPTS